MTILSQSLLPDVRNLGEQAHPFVFPDMFPPLNINVEVTITPVKYSCHADFFAEDQMLLSLGPCISMDATKLLLTFNGNAFCYPVKLNDLAESATTLKIVLSNNELSDKTIYMVNAPDSKHKRADIFPETYF
mmetsp:Transcript_5280/g.6423  ORF Transcript_5280/g.6423 Transcript_5280/m.6423 type:complete len:132 (-) Transcript_5280:312-707(-)